MVNEDSHRPHNSRPKTPSRDIAAGIAEDAAKVGSENGAKPSIEARKRRKDESRDENDA